MKPWWVVRPPTSYACRNTCTQCALLQWPLQPGRYSDAEQVEYLHLQETVRGRG